MSLVFAALVFLPLVATIGYVLFGIGINFNVSAAALRVADTGQLGSCTAPAPEQGHVWSEHWLLPWDITQQLQRE